MAHYKNVGGAPSDGDDSPPPRQRSGRTCAQVTPKPEGQRHGGRPPPRARGQPSVEHFDLRGATTRQVQSLHFVEVARWFPP
jgi:hypothetical protein